MIKGNSGLGERELKIPRSSKSTFMGATGENTKGEREYWTINEQAFREL
jgi:hypothetical protein